MTSIAWALVSTEAIKVRRTLAVWMALLTPAVLLAIEFFNLLDDRSPAGPDPGVMWRDLLLGGWLWWLALILPMLICFEAASLANVEHSSKGWKQLFSLPIPRWGIFATKMLFCGMLMGASFVILVIGFVSDVLVASGIHGWQLASAIPMGDIAATAGQGYLASWQMIAIQTWLSRKFPGIAAAGIGFAGLVTGFVLLGIFARRGAMPDVASGYP